MNLSLTAGETRPLAPSAALTPRRHTVACRAGQVDLLEKPTPLHRTALGAFELVARSTGLSWHSRAEAQTLLPELQKNMEQVKNPKLAAPSDYPAYVLEGGLHGYPHGNLHANSSLDAESAVAIFHGMVMGNPLHPAQASATWRTSTTGRVADYYAQTHRNQPEKIVDLCCGTGASSTYLRRAFPQAGIVGVDASPMHLAEALRTGSPGVSWKHALAANTGLPAHAQDLVTLTLSTHEVPLSEVLKMFGEARRLLRRGGVFALTDVPQFKNTKSIFNTMYDLLERFDIEPNLAGFRSANFPQRLTDVGFADVEATNPGVPCLQVLARKA